LAVTVKDNAAFQRALAALQAGNLKDAERLFKAVLRTQPKHVAALNLIGVILTQLARFTEAETYLRRALQEHANSDATLYNYGIVLKALDRPAEAMQRFTEALAIAPEIAETWNNRGAAFNDLKRHDEAVADFERAVRLNPRYAEAFCNKGKSLLILKRFDEALSAFKRALALKPDLAEAWLGFGNTFFELKRYDEALAAYREVLALKPDLTEARLGSGNVFYEFKRYDEALAAYQEVLALKPDLAEAWLRRGNAFYELKRYDEALAAYDKALALDRDYSVAYSNRGSALLSLRRYPEALASCNRAISLDPDLASAYSNRGSALLNLKRLSEALASCDQAIALDPGLASAYSNRGSILLNLKQFSEALASCDQAISLDPSFATAHSNRGAVLISLNQHLEALASCDRAISLDPGLATIHVTRGVVLLGLQRYSEALASFDRAAALDPGLASAHGNRAVALMILGHHADSFAAADKAFAIEPDLNYLAGNRLFAKLQLCSWNNLDVETSHLLSALRNRQLVITPFFNLAIPSLPVDQLHCAQLHIAENNLSGSSRPPWRGNIPSHDRMRVAYVSSDLRDHPVAHLTAGLFEHHDKSRFEVTAISLGPEQDSDFCRRIRASFERFVDIPLQSDRNIADLIRQLEIDIAVDLNGFTQNGRTDVFAQRPAPIQVSYLGYSGTMGADYYDYIIADRTVIPEEHFDFYSEKAVWLPDSFLVNDAARPIVERTPTRGELHLPETGFVFCCFNQSYKLNPTIFDVWMRLLKAVDGSVLWLREYNETALHNLRLEAERRGVAPERLVFAPPVPLIAEHLARHRQADLFLDTLPYNGHTTAADALWAGLPVVTCLGSAFAGRVAASLLQAVGLSELITASLEDYEALALKLARDPVLLASLKAKLARNRGTYPLFDTGRFTRNLEAAYTTMWRRYQNAEPPASFAVMLGD